jgi:hypothetical protein
VRERKVGATESMDNYIILDENCEEQTFCFFDSNISEHISLFKKFNCTGLVISVTEDGVTIDISKIREIDKIRNITLTINTKTAKIKFAKKFDNIRKLLITTKSPEWITSIIDFTRVENLEMQGADFEEISQCTEIHAKNIHLTGDFNEIDLSKSPRIKTLNISECKTIDVANIKNADNLETLIITGDKIKNKEFITKMKSIKNLKAFSKEKTQDWSFLNGTKIEKLHLYMTSSTEFIAESRTLKTVFIGKILSKTGKFWYGESSGGAISLNSLTQLSYEKVDMVFLPF